MNSSYITIPEGVGVGFHPSDKKLLCHLEKKNQGMDSQITVIPEIDLCKHEPRDLPALVFKRAGSRDREWLFKLTMADDPVDREWFFFSRRDFKYSNSNRYNRTTQQGSWKKQGDDRIMENGGKRILTFYEAGELKANKTKSSWVIHEIYLIEPHSKPPRQIGDFVLCRLKNHSGEFDLRDEAEPSSGSCSMISNVENQAAVAKGNHDEAEPGIASDLEIQAASNDALTEEELNLEFNAMIEKLLDDHELESLDSFFPQPPPPHPHQLPQPHPRQDYHPSILQSPIYEQPGNVSHATNVSNDESRKRNYPFGDKDPSLTKKNNISTNDDDELGRNTASNSENQAAHEIPEGNSEPGANLGSAFDSFPPQDYNHAPPSINGEPGDFSHDNDDFIEWDDLPPLVEDIGSPLA